MRYYTYITALLLVVVLIMGLSQVTLVDASTSTSTYTSAAVDASTSAPIVVATATTPTDTSRTKIASFYVAGGCSEHSFAMDVWSDDYHDRDGCYPLPSSKYKYFKFHVAGRPFSGYHCSGPVHKPVHLEQCQQHSDGSFVGGIKTGW